MAYRLARKASSDYVNGWRDFVYVVNIVKHWDRWPVLGQNALAIGIPFAKPVRFEVPSALQAQIDAANPRKQGADAEHQSASSQRVDRSLPK